MSTLLKFFLTAVLLQLHFFSWSQVTSPPPATAAVPRDTVKVFEIIKGPSMRSIYIDSATTLQTIAGGAVVRQGTTLFTADSIAIDPRTHIAEGFGHVHINQADSVQTYGDYLRYTGADKTAVLTNNVKLVDKNATLYTQNLDYNLNSGIGNYHGGGKVINGKTTITSLDGTYYADTKDIYFKNGVEVVGQNRVSTDSLLYNLLTQNYSLNGKTYIKNKETEIFTNQGSYDNKFDNTVFTSRTRVRDSSGRVYVANNMAMDNKSGNAQLEGNAIIRDSAGGFMVFANQVFLNKKTNSFLATRRPVLVIKQKDDSIYVAADTIFSGFSTEVKSDQFILAKDSLAEDSIRRQRLVDSTDLSDSLRHKADISGVLQNAADKRAFTNDSLSKAGHNIHLPAISRGRERAIAEDTSAAFTSRHLFNRAYLVARIKDYATATIQPYLKMPAFSMMDSLKGGIAPKRPPRNNTKRSRRLERQKEQAAADLLKNNASRPPNTAAKNPVNNNVKPLSSDAKLRMLDDDGDTTRMALQRDTSLVGLTVKLPANRSLARRDSIHLHVKDSTTKPDSSRYFLAFHRVRIYSDSLQSVCDSLFFSAKDSAFRLFYDPIIWSGHSQIAGDTIFLYTKNKKPERLHAFNKGMIINKTTQGFYNQISGKTINGIFNNGTIDYMRVKGSQAESIYYAQDSDSAYLGMNRATGDVIDLYFVKDELQKVLFVNDIAGKFYPMKKIPSDQRYLKNFLWVSDRRPKNKLELFE